MRMLINCLIAALCLCTAASLTACEKKQPNPAADAIEKAGENLEKAGDEAKDAADDAAEKLRESGK
jgi:hypothetical protein